MRLGDIELSEAEVEALRALLRQHSMASATPNMSPLHAWNRRFRSGLERLKLKPQVYSPIMRMATVETKRRVGGEIIDVLPYIHHADAFVVDASVLEFEEWITAVPFEPIRSGLLSGRSFGQASLHTLLDAIAQYQKETPDAG